MLTAQSVPVHSLRTSAASSWYADPVFEPGFKCRVIQSTIGDPLPASFLSSPRVFSTSFIFLRII